MGIMNMEMVFHQSELTYAYPKNLSEKLCMGIIDMKMVFDQSVLTYEHPRYLSDQLYTDI